MKLSDKACKAAQPKAEQWKLSDGDGMYLLIMPRGSKLWRMNYRFEGRHKTLALGVYPQVSLAGARDKRNEARAQIGQGIDPAAHRAEVKLLRGISKDDSFETVAREWHTKNIDLWSDRYGAQVLRVMQKNLFPSIGKMKLNSITPLILLATLRKMEGREAHDLLKDALNYTGRVFRYGIITSRAERDPSADLKGAFKPHIAKHHPSLKAEALSEFLKKLNQQEDGMGKLGIQLVLLTLVRTTEARAAAWHEFKDGGDKWVIPPERMKGRIEHTVPLSTQARALLEKIKLKSGGGYYLFPNAQGRETFMSENTMLNLLYEMGYKGITTVHGLRSLASTILHESGEFESLVIERQLAHVDKNEVRGAYNHAEYYAERQRMVQWWADYLDGQAAKEG